MSPWLAFFLGGILIPVGVWLLLGVADWCIHTWRWGRTVGRVHFQRLKWRQPFEHSRLWRAHGNGHKGYAITLSPRKRAGWSMSIKPKPGEQP